MIYDKIIIGISFEEIRKMLKEFGITTELGFHSNPYCYYPNYMSGESKCATVSVIGEVENPIDLNTCIDTKYGKFLCPVSALDFLYQKNKVVGGTYLIHQCW